MTEEEAKTKWCFATRIGEGGANRAYEVDPAGEPIMQDIPRCIGSACMAWRKTSDVPGEVLERRDMGATPPPEGWLRSNTEHPDTINKSFGDWIRPGPWKPAGYCGLAGAPQ